LQQEDEDVVLTEIESADTSAAPAPPAPPPPPPPGTFYRVNSSRATFAELWRDVRSPAVVIIWITKLLGVKLPGSVNDPNVETLEPFLVAREQIPADAIARLDATLAELRPEGFEAKRYLAIVDLFHSSRTYVALLAHREGKAVGRIMLRTEGQVKLKTHFFTEFVSEFTDGTFLHTSSATAALNPPPGTRLNHKLNLGPRELWASHRQELSHETATARKQVAQVHPADGAALLGLVERYHAAVRDFNLRRKLFAPMDEADLRQAATIAEKYSAADRGELQYPDVMAELHKLQTKRTNWVSGLLILGVSLALFIGAGMTQKWESIWLLIAILFFHEMGHYVAMRLFGYRNLQMLFIPFLGAAVSGRNYTAPGWKKVIVALAGPLPGIVVGAVLAGVGIYQDKPVYLSAALLALLLNGFNLLPVLPLDGGRVAQTILFARHHLLDVAFRIMAAAVLALGGFFAGDKILLYIGIFMLISIPAAYKLAKIATELRRTGMRPADLPADNVIPAADAAPIIQRVQAAFPLAKGPKMVAQHTLQVYETLATRPPGWLASIFFGLVHGGSIVFTLIVLMVVVLAQHGSLKNFARAAAQMPPTRLDPTAIVVWESPTRAVATQPATTAPAAPQHSTVIATFDKLDAAQAAMDEVRARSPAGARAVLLGQSVLLALPAGDTAGRSYWVERFDTQTKQVFVQGERIGASMTVTFLARNNAEADALVETINDAAGRGGSMHLIPPWQPDDPRSTDEIARHDRARRTYAKLESIASKAWDDPRIRELSKKSGEAIRRGDEAEATRIETQQQEVYKEVRAAELKKIVDSTDDSIDHDLVKRYVELEKLKPEEQYTKRVTELGPFMGQLPMAGKNPAPGADRYAVQFGFASNAGLLVTVRGLSFHDVSYGAPAFIHWLREKRHALDFRYQFARGGLFDGFDPDELEEK
jgi:Zn-dependent protease